MAVVSADTASDTVTTNGAAIVIATMTTAGIGAEDATATKALLSGSKPESYPSKGEVPNITPLLRITAIDLAGRHETMACWRAFPDRGHPSFRTTPTSADCRYDLMEVPIYRFTGLDG
jgi:hypothetical protein